LYGSSREKGLYSAGFTKKLKWGWTSNNKLNGSTVIIAYGKQNKVYNS